MTEKRLPLRPYPLGAHCEEGGIRFSFVSEKEKCGIVLYERETGKRLRRIPFSKEEKIGDIYCKFLEGLDGDSISYQFYEEDRIAADPYARGFLSDHTYGRARQESGLRAVLLKTDFEWEGDKRPGLAYEDCVCSCIHVRGFTRHPSSGVSCGGTFLGVTEKLPYLKESGFTTIELQPCYEFIELSAEPSFETSAERPEAKKEQAFHPRKEASAAGPRLNYWGYKKGFYYAPKAGYAASKNPCVEFKNMVKAFHKNNMEIVMQFYFPKDAEGMDISEILRFWVLEYHVDGFHLMGENLPVNQIAKDPALSDTKLWYYAFDADEIYRGRTREKQKNLAVYQDDYMYIMRRFLKGDENMLESVIHQMRCNPRRMGRIHYITNYYGFTLADMVSYDRKHNEANGEGNRDGSNYNCSWNCGEEGITRRKKVKELRLKQMKNAICLLLFSQSVPLLFMGDEFGNSQKGNNNPYCQDNAVAWLNWNDLEKNRELYDFWCKMTALRKAHPILHPGEELKGMDYLALGYPDLSYHGRSAWKPQLEGYNRHIGIMYCGRYEKLPDSMDDDFFYLAVNMYWEYQKLAMPKLPKGLQWKLVCVTAGEDQMKDEGEETHRRIPPRSIAVFQSISVDAAGKQVV